MRFNELEENMVVYDRWWPEQIGVVTEVQKTGVILKAVSDDWPYAQYGELIRYDRAHVQFLERKEDVRRQAWI